MEEISIVRGDITKAKVDIIVNAANPKMLGGGGVDGAIHNAAGPKILEACRKVKSINGIRCPIGEARITEAGNLKAKYVIHTVGPRYKVDENPEMFLKSAYKNTLKLAVKYGCESIAFPAISCGAYGYPIDKAAYVAFETWREEEFKGLSIIFYLFGSDINEVWNKVLSSSVT